MATSDKVFAGSIPKFYDTLMVPLIFEAYAAHVAELVASFAPGAVLETAAGSGAVTRALAPKLGADARYVVTDLNQPMLDYAASRQGVDGRITWRQADALALPFEDNAFDLVCCQFGAMFFPDKAQAYAQARRVLQPGGLFLFSVWDTLADNEFADVVTTALAGLFPDDPPRFLARTPHGHCDPVCLTKDLAQAGFTAPPQFNVVTARSRAASAAEVALAYCQGTPLRNEIEARDATRLAEATALCTEALAQRFGRGAVDGKIQALVVGVTR